MKIIDKYNKRDLEAHKKASLVNGVIEEIYSSGFVQDSQGTKYPHDSSSVSFQAGALLYNFVREIKPDRTIEVGMAYGLSSLFICQALLDNGGGHHTAIDPFQDSIYKSVGLLNVERAGLNKNFRFYEARSEEVLPQLVCQNEKFDFAFIDGSHLFDNAFVDFFFIDKLIQEQGYIAIDDLWMPSVRKVASFILKNKSSYALIRPFSSSKTPLDLRCARAVRRVLQNPFGRDWSLKLVPENVAFFQKIGQDKRPWDFHKEF